MTGREWLEVEQAMVLLWPSYRPDPDEARARAGLVGELWAGLTRDAALAAVRSLSMEGREFAPTPGQIARRAQRQARTRPPGWDEAWAAIRAATRGGGGLDGKRRLEALPAPVAAWARPRWHELCYAPVEAERGGAIIAAWRREYEAWTADEESCAAALRRERARRELPPAGLAELEATARANIDSNDGAT